MTYCFKFMSLVASINVAGLLLAAAKCLHSHFLKPEMQAYETNYRYPRGIAEVC